MRRRLFWNSRTTDSPAAARSAGFLHRLVPRLAACSLLTLWAAALPLTAAVFRSDVVVYGATPGGIAAAITAARMGQTASLIEYHAHIGGMAASGLGKSDIETREAIGGLFREFVGRVRQYYVNKYGPDSPNVKLCRDGYYYEPSVAERVFDEMVAAEPRIRVFRRHRLEETMRTGNRIVGFRATNLTSGEVEEFRGGVFIDGSYEGDLAAYAGARYRLGRESRAEFNELHAGVVYQNYETKAFLPGTTGEGDGRIQAYTFRLCLTSDPANSHVLRQPPPGYDRTRYLGYLDDWKAGRMDAPKVLKDGVGYFAPTFGTLVRALSIAELPNGKLDVNINPRLLGFPFAEVNYGYPDADWNTRERIAAQIRDLTLGLIYFLQNDSAVPASHRALANRFHLAKDEFADNDNFPWQLYVREARRIVGEYTLSEHDITSAAGFTRPPIHADSIAAGEFPIDSFPVRKREAGHDQALEGYILMLDQFTRPYQIPYRIIVPEQVEGLLVPVAASTTHVAFSTIRLEPTWMALGQAAGVAAHLAISSQKPLRKIDVSRMQRELLRQSQVLTYFRDIDHTDPAFAAIQYLGTRGLFPEYEARGGSPLDPALIPEWSRLAHVPPSTSVPPLTRAEFCRRLYEAGR